MTTKSGVIIHSQMTDMSFAFLTDKHKTATKNAGKVYKAFMSFIYDENYFEDYDRLKNRFLNKVERLGFERKEYFSENPDEYDIIKSIRFPVRIEDRF